jgi:arabinoxylan arabinofuranohydrolase
MKTRFPLAAVSLTALFMELAATMACANYPIFSQRFTADPAPIVVGDRVYVFCSHDLDGQGWWWMKDFTCISSDDLVNWTDHGEVFDATRDTTWADMAWAPQVVAANGKFYLYYSTGIIHGEKKRGAGKTGVAVADGILGPYKDPLGGPMIDDKTYSDPTVLPDDDGRAWIYLNHGRRARLNPDMISLAAPPVQMERAQIPDFLEGPWITKVNGKYNLSYSTRSLPGYGYSLAQTVADRPDGDFSYKGLCFWLGPDNKPNTHGGFFQLGGNWYLIYHNCAVAKERKVPVDFQRSICIDRVYFNADGTARPFTSTRDGMPQLKYVNPYVRQSAVMMAAESGIQTVPCDEGGRALTAREAGGWIKVQGVDFGRGPDRIDLRLSCSAGAERPGVELCLDHPDAAAVAAFKAPSAKERQRWATVSVPVSGMAGVHDLYLRFAGKKDPEFAVQWWQCHAPWYRPGDRPSPAVPPAVIEKTVHLVAQGNKKYVRLGQDGRLQATASNPEEAATFRLIDNRDATWSLQSVSTKRYATVSGNWTADASISGPAQRFFLYGNPDGSWCLRSEADGLFLRLDEATGALVSDFSEEKQRSPRLRGPSVMWKLEECAP